MSADDMNAAQARERLYQTLERDLVGPQGGADELLRDRPTDVYVTGLLFPRQSAEQHDETAAEQDDEQDSADKDEEQGPGTAISMTSMRGHSSIGMSFSVEGGAPGLKLTGHAGRYEPVESGHDERRQWRRSQIAWQTDVPVTEGLASYPGEGPLKWWVRGLKTGGAWQVTVVLENDQEPAEPGREARERATFLQVGFEVRPRDGTRFVPRMASRVRAGADEDALSAALIYRDAKEWAAGHTCAATWDDDEAAAVVRTTWLPRQTVAAVSPDGHDRFRDFAMRRSGTADGPFVAATLASADKAELRKLLAVIPDAYEQWLKDEAQRAETMAVQGALGTSDLAQAREHFARAEVVKNRIRSSIVLINDDASVRSAFQLAQRAMDLQDGWKAQSQGRKPAGLKWRPFQLAFQLLALAGMAKPLDANGQVSSERRTMDLLWFPTGGGKTEAYLGLIAFDLFFRRLRNKTPERGAGVCVIMRYTLRLLTVQQFERASRLILACEKIRRVDPGLKGRGLGRTPFSIGLWVGEGTTPNWREDARGSDAKKAQQLSRCPACASEDSLRWDPEPEAGPYAVICTSPSCEMANELLPIWTVDEDVYEQRPSLLLGTIDKFAQVPLRQETHGFFGGSDADPPDLIIQDELHLITGPLGTVTALYESAIDLLCTSSGVPPKVIGSTATIRRAEPQVRALFDRTVCQFPPPILDSADSCFGVPDERAPGRLYVGVTTAGRSPKFTLQAVAASLLQAASELPDHADVRDPFWTLVAYFNSLRELGGAHVMMHDDVRDSIELYSGLHGAPARAISEELQELTSRVPSDEIPTALKELERPYPNQIHDVTLATNMLSVGVDIPRLGLMVVNGQPKSMAEYIQASSRVGRNQVPGLIVTVYNSGRPRDRSHFESFRTWHQMLYREVEATSVTPFAPRARDKALHAALVAMVRHLVPGMLVAPTLSVQREEAALAFADFLAARAEHMEAERAEAPFVAAEARQFLETWRQRGLLDYYRNDWEAKRSLLVSAEAAAREQAAGRPIRGGAKSTPNSMREVEPTVQLRMPVRLAKRSDGT